jgi:alkanesulfonate monooxygenase SsuD/methylene tetrahydromethanopterin reductase-like flavin-dependent oxidoreductase (luciferase family)
MVTGNTYRHPGLLAKIAVTVDHLSGGRLEFGFGAGWNEIEHTMLDLEFGRSPGERIRWMAEAIDVIKALWTQDHADYQGTRYRLRNAFANPKPLQQPYPPVWIGGSGERKTLRVVAEQADVWNLGGAEPDEAARLSGVLDRHCADVGRDPAEVRRSVQVRYGDGRDLPGRIAPYVERGFSEIVVIVAGGQAEREGEAVAGLLPQLRGLAGSDER